MRNTLSLSGGPGVALAVAIVGMVVLSGAIQSQGAVTPVNDLPNPYETTSDWGKFPGGRIFGNTSGVDIDPDGKSVWAVDRCGADSCAGSNLTVVLKFDPSGRLVKSFGAGMLVYPHGIHVDRSGNVWVTDGRAATPEELKKFPGEKAKGHTVIKFSPEGKVLMTLGKPGVAGDPPGFFNEPAAVITAPNGDIFVADGHSGGENTTPSNKVARIVKFDRSGKFIKSWGKFGAGPRSQGAARPRLRLPRPLVRRGPRELSSPDLRSGRQAPRRVETIQPRERAVHQERHDLHERLGIRLARQPGLEKRHPDRQRHGRQGHVLHSAARE